MHDVSFEKSQLVTKDANFFVNVERVKSSKLAKLKLAKTLPIIKYSLK